MLPPICDCSGAPGSGANIRPLSRTSCLQPPGRHAGLDVDPPELGLERADAVEPVEREHDAAVRDGARRRARCRRRAGRSARRARSTTRARRRPPRPSRGSTTASARPGSRVKSVRYSAGSPSSTDSPNSRRRSAITRGTPRSARRPPRRRPPGRSGRRSRRAPRAARRGSTRAIASATSGAKIGSESPNRTSAGFSHERQRLADRHQRRGVRMLRLGRHLLGERERARLRLGRRERRVVGRDDLVGESAHAAPVRISRPAWKSPPAARTTSRKRSHVSLGARPPPTPVFRITSRSTRSGLLDREPQADRPAPVLDDDRQPAQVELLDEPHDRRAVPVERVPADVGRLVRAAEAEVVGRDHPRVRARARDHLPVEERPGRLAVEAEHRIALALVEVVHPQAVLVERSAARTGSRAGPRTARRACGRRVIAAPARRGTRTTSGSRPGLDDPRLAGLARARGRERRLGDRARAGSAGCPARRPTARSSASTIGVSAKPGQSALMRDPALGELRRDRADEADDRVLRQRVDRVERHRHQAGERRRRDDRRRPAPSPAPSAATPKTTPSTFAPTARRYAASASVGDVVRAGGDTGVQEREVDRPRRSPTPPGRRRRTRWRGRATRTSHPSASSSATAAAPIPEAPPVTSALRNKDDLADVAALLDQARARRPPRASGNSRADDRPDRALRPRGATSSSAASRTTSGASCISRPR